MCLGESPGQIEANGCIGADHAVLDSCIKACLLLTREYPSPGTLFEFRMTDTASDRTSCSILDWDRDHPEDKTKWVLQQPALIDIEPPYVYTVVSRFEPVALTPGRNLR